MSRVKSSAAILVEGVLAKYNGNINYRSFQRTPEYQASLNAGTDINQAFYNSVKARWRLSTLGNKSPVAMAASATATAATPTYAPTYGAATPAASAVQSAQAVLQSMPMTFEPVAYDYDPEIAQMIPDVDDNFIFTDNNKDIINLVQNHSKVANVNIRLVGPAGCGKTSFAINYASRRKAPALVMDCANVREPRDWFGYRTFDPATKDIVWHESMFVRMVETPGAVIVLDELNRVSPMVTNTLIPLLDHRAKTYLEEAGRTIKIAEGVTFWAAVNEGNQFTGTITMDAAMKNRFSYVVECNFLDAKTESQVLRSKTGLDVDSCRKLVEVANQVRTKAMMDAVDSFSEPVSTRMLEAAALAMVMGGPKTLSYTLLNHYNNAGGASSERESLRKLLVGKFGSI
jgi:nitric oxide reductase NorQ protein